MIVICTLCYGDFKIPLNEFLDMKPDDEYICPECANRIKEWVKDAYSPDMYNGDDIEIYYN